MEDKPMLRINCNDTIQVYCQRIYPDGTIKPMMLECEIDIRSLIIDKNDIVHTFVTTKKKG